MNNKFLSNIWMLIFISTNAHVFAQKKFVIERCVIGKEGKAVVLDRFTEEAIQSLGVDTIRDSKFKIAVPFDELSLGILEIDEKFGGTVALEPKHLNYKMGVDGGYVTSGGKYTAILTGYLKLQEYIDADHLFNRITKGGGDIAAIKGT